MFKVLAIQNFPNFNEFPFDWFWKPICFNISESCIETNEKDENRYIIIRIVTSLKF